MEQRHERVLTPNEYQKLAMRTSNKELRPVEHLINGALGLAGEAGEVADLVKKTLFQGHDLDHEHIAKECSDVFWYLAETATALGYSLEEIMAANIEKLRRRYPEGFNSERSIHRSE